MAQTHQQLDVAYAREQFPAIQPSDFIFADNAGGSAVLGSVGQRVAKYLTSTNVQLGASYVWSRKSGDLVAAANFLGKLWINAAEVSEIIMGASTTQLVENLARAMEPFVKDGDEFIISETDHEANVGPFAKLAKRRGLNLKVWKCNHKTYELELDDLRALMSPRTRLVAVTHCSNILGSVNDVKAIADVVHSVPGAEIIVDGVAYAPHRSIDVQELNIDYYVFSWYKVYGPHISMLYAKTSTAARLDSLAHFFLEKTKRPYAYQPGGVCYELVSSLPAILAYIGDLARPPSDRLGTEGGVSAIATSGATREELERGFELIAHQETQILSPLLKYLLSHPDDYTIIGRKEAGVDRVPTVSFLLKGVRSQDVVLGVEKFDPSIGIRFGHFYAYRLIAALFDGTGLDVEDGIVRISLVHYNTASEVQRIIEALESVRTRKLL